MAAAAILVVVATAAAQAPPNVPARPEKKQDYEFHGPGSPKPSEDFSQYLFSDWMGVRSRLADHGVTVAVLFIADPFGNVSGGVRRGAAVYNLAAFGLTVHTERLLGWPGGQFHLGFAANFGTSLSRDYVGNAFPIQLADVADPHPRLTYLSYTQSSGTIGSASGWAASRSTACPARSSSGRSTSRRSHQWVSIWYRSDYFSTHPVHSAIRTLPGGRASSSNPSINSMR